MARRGPRRRAELTIRAEKTKTRRARRLPISSRLLAVLEMRRLDPSGQPYQPDADWQPRQVLRARNDHRTRR